MRYLRECSNTPEVLWLRAQSVAGQEEHLLLLEQVVFSQDPVYAPMAQKILDREHQFEFELSQPPEYKFWKQPTWQARFAKLKQQRMWLAGIALVLGMTIFLVIGLITQERKKLELASIALTQTAVYTPIVITPAPTQSVTALPANRQPSVTYPEGQLWLVRWELPTNRSVLMSSYDEVPATPAAGSKFAAVQYRFICRMAICDTPPQADVLLKLADGQVIDYSSQNRPILAEDAAAPRVAQDQEVYGWLVFEVPDRGIPVTLLIRTENDEEIPAYELPWPK